MGKRTHRHIDQITRNGKALFCVNRKVGKTTKHLGHAPTLDEAVAILQRSYPEEGFTKAGLAVAARCPVRMPHRKYAKVYYEPSRKGGNKWLQHENYGGRTYWETEQDCAEAVAAFLEVPLCELLLPKACASQHPLGAQQAIFTALYGIAEGVLPGDAVDMQKRAASREVHVQFQKNPGIIATFIVTKRAARGI